MCIVCMELKLKEERTLNRKEAAIQFVAMADELEKIDRAQRELGNEKARVLARQDEARKILASSVGSNVTEKAWRVDERVVLARFQGGVTIVRTEED